MRSGKGRGMERVGALAAQRPWARTWEKMHQHLQWQGTGYAAAALGTAVATVGIRLITTVIHAGNLSLLYLVVVLWIATAFSRGPALMAALLSFLMYDFFFVPPLYSFAVAYPSGYVSLGALLLAGLVTGQLATQVRRREQTAVESAQRITTLYELTQVTASPDTGQVPLALVRQLARAFANQGVHTVTLYRPTPDGTDDALVLAAITHSPAAEADGLVFDQPAFLLQAVRARQSRACVAFPSASRRLPSCDPLYTMLVPLGTGDGIVGVLGITGTHALYGPTNPAGPDPLFVAYRDLLALAVERDNLQREAIQSAAQQESARVKEAFLAAMTHDLRTPLAAIQTVVESGLQPAKKWAVSDVRDMLELIATSTRRLNRLVDNVLVLSRLEANAMPTATCWYPIEELIATAREQLDLAGLTAGRTLTVEIQPDIVLVPVVHEHMERVLINLLENAVQYSPPGSPISLDVRAGNPDRVTLRVHDEGIGIPVSERTAIFNKFYRLSPALPWRHSAAPKGTGLGLAICASIVRAHGGHMWIEGDQGSGTTVVVDLPWPAKEAREAQRYEEAGHAAEASQLEYEEVWG